jgi:hypothetical protein
MSGEKPLISFPTEHYEIEITGLKDNYQIGESYSFSYVLRGFGTPCGAKTITFPINKTDSVTVGSSSSCIKTPMVDFVLDIEKTYGTRYGHIALPEAGNYTVQIQFEKGIGGPTITEKSFTVINP